ncbi:MAG: hypothetical protein ACM30G_13120 [Micromonosporaceae bacterium]
MTTRASTRSLAVAIFLGAGFGAAQMGLGYGLGAIAWVTPGAAIGAATNEAAWVASLAWATWAAATSVVAGAVCAEWFSGIDGGVWNRIGWRAVIALAAALGALVTVPLVAVPARAAQLSTNFAPHLLAGVYATTGVVIGLIAAIAAFTSRALATNVLASMVWLWLLAMIAVGEAVSAGRTVTFAQLGVWRLSDGGPTWRGFAVPSTLVMLGAAFVIGALVAWRASRRGGNRVGMAISGAFGPLLVAGAYFLVTPAFGQAPAEQVSAYLSAPYAIIAGLAGSVLTTALVGFRRARATDQPEPADAAGLLAAPRGYPAAATSVPLPAAARLGLGQRPGAVTGKASVPAASRAYPEPGRPL